MNKLQHTCLLVCALVLPSGIIIGGISWYHDSSFGAFLFGVGISAIPIYCFIVKYWR